MQFVRPAFHLFSQLVSPLPIPTLINTPKRAPTSSCFDLAWPLFCVVFVFISEEVRSLNLYPLYLFSLLFVVAVLSEKFAFFPLKLISSPTAVPVLTQPIQILHLRLCL
jgi:hypothetical protein